jgi:hypothetical protein
VHEQDQVSTTDPDFTYATKGGTPARLGYYDNHLVDNDSCVIVGVHATEGANESGERRRRACSHVCAAATSRASLPGADATSGNGQFLQSLLRRLTLGWPTT